MGNFKSFLNEKRSSGDLYAYGSKKAAKQRRRVPRNYNWSTTPDKKHYTVSDITTPM